MRTKPSQRYISPTDTDITSAAKLVGLRRFSPMFVRDIANIASGGEVLPPSAYRETVRKQAEDRVGNPSTSHNASYNYSYRSKRGAIIRDDYPDRKAAIDAQFDSDMRYHDKVCDFLRDIDLSEAPGRTPLGQAVSLLRIMSQMEGGTGDPNDSDTIPVIADDITTTRDVSNQLKERIELVQSLDNAEKHLLGMEDKKEDDEQESPHLSTGDLKKIASITNLKPGQDQVLEVARNLETLSQMDVRKRTHLEHDVEGDDIRVREIRGFDELNSLRAEEYALPEDYRLMRIATRATSIRERAKRIDNKQLLYMIVDASGSMDNPKRINKACGIVMNRLKAVVNEDAELYLAFFSRVLYDEHSAKNPSEARALMEIVEQKHFDGIGTAIAKCARLAAKRIEKMMEEDKSLTRPELAIVTDGEDSCDSMKREDFGKTVVHAFIVDSTNQYLAEFARSTGGSAIDKL